LTITSYQSHHKSDKEANAKTKKIVHHC